MVNNSHSTAIDNKAKTNGETLPQTGEKSSKIGIILGLLTISLASLFGLGKKDRKKD
nr:LPXTG cell wall anchor domain-containing protein [Lactobacillus crispatus]